MATLELPLGFFKAAIAAPIITPYVGWAGGAAFLAGALFFAGDLADISVTGITCSWLKIVEILRNLQSPQRSRAHDGTAFRLTRSTCL